MPFGVGDGDDLTIRTATGPGLLFIRIREIDVDEIVSRKVWSCNIVRIERGIVGETQSIFVAVVRGGIIVRCVRVLRLPQAEEDSDRSICDRTDRSIESRSGDSKIAYLCS